MDPDDLIHAVAMSRTLEAQYQRAQMIADFNKERRREQCRVSQKIFRERKKREQAMFEATVQSLAKEVQQLEQRKAELVRYVPLQHILAHQPDFDGGVPARLTRKYISMFKNGYIPSKRRASDRQERFLHAFASCDVVYNGAIGVQSILDNWVRYTTSFSSVALETLSCDVMKTDDGAIVRGVTRSSLKMNRQSIERFFPNCPEVLKPMLIGQVLTVVAVMHFSFNDEDILVQLSGRGDFTSGLLAILRNSEDVEAVLAKSRIIPQITSTPQTPCRPPAQSSSTSSPNQSKMDLGFIQV
ncbi:hypothetical protein AC1031_000915 [Aphanomyces cochlioides]|nr:hypothetical protein AC1031_000915 [Aphanomyces cochlioides]